MILVIVSFYLFRKFVHFIHLHVRELLVCCSTALSHLSISEPLKSLKPSDKNIAKTSQ